ncbi:hypothetical protein [Raineyella sp. LH-20]|uniref:hypothetical protein n=1 Tax=Raineyella sp. LH-20 TaxID=3081204 RepID=UPI002954DD05|nr:hypothetical protein [Raineyella sp. LH-20]WOP17251.1 hypothetical protein R0146_08105 [Raineyella sp. LH-20]
MVLPTGEERSFTAEEMFFSTTDDRGVIAEANTTFVRLSRYSWDALIGAPHNIIRHPQMPGAAFRVMWDTLQAGRPFAAYVHNLAADGVRYDVFAAITPLRRGGYLSVRSRPCRPDLLQLVDTVYQPVAEREAALRAAGVGRAEAAVQGAEMLGDLLQQQGLSSYQDLQRILLPAEVTALDEAIGGIPARPEARGELAIMLDEVHQVFDELGAWMADLSVLSDSAQRMSDTVDHLDHAMRESMETARQIGEVTDLDAVWVPMMMPLNLWAAMGVEVSSVLNALIQDLDTARGGALDSRMQIALARMFTQMVGRFLVELIDGGPGTERAMPAIRGLCEALVERIDEMETRLAEHSQARNHARQQVDEAAGLLQIPVDLMDAWRAMAAGRALPDSIATLVPRIEQQVAESRQAMDRLRELVPRRSATEASRDSSGLRSRVAAIAAAAGGHSIAV